MRRSWLIASAVVLVALLAAIPAVASSRTMGVGGPRIPLRAGGNESLNWAGYADVVSSGSVTVANASFIVPTVQPSKSSTYVSVWVGIDGYNDSTVEQTGILAESSHGSVSYSAWYEFYPSSPVYAPSNDHVKPGDFIVAWVQYNSNNGTFTTFLKDINESWTFISPATSVTGADRSSAEWIVERPAIGGSLTTLANFGTAHFGLNYTGVSGTCYADINGVYSNISAFNYYPINMTNNNGQTIAYPSGLLGGGTSFNVTYGSGTSSTSSPHGHK
ncbi:G1 family glutamic endopeptidase [Conexivisphaera calida]|nr:G1 family glutamic endopeptidase [Conexivisphaera calida]